MDPITVGGISSIMGILCGIIAVIAGNISSNKKAKMEKELRQSIIENGIDAETAKVLITTEKEKKSNFALYAGCVLIGFGLGYFFGLEWFTPNEGILGIFGTGVGLLIAFIIDNRLKKEKAREREENPSA